MNSVNPSTMATMMDCVVVMFRFRLQNNAINLDERGNADNADFSDYTDFVFMVEAYY